MKKQLQLDKKIIKELQENPVSRALLHEAIMWLELEKETEELERVCHKK